MLIIFDLDHTLYNSDKFLTARTEKTRIELAKHLGISVDEAKEIFKRKRQELLEQSNTDRITATKTLEAIGIPRSKFLEILDSIHPREHVTFDQKAYDVVKELAKEHELVVLSNSPKSQVVKTLEVLRVNEFFTQVYGADDFHDSKPNPELFRKIAEMHGYPAEKVVSVGDDIHKEMIPSKSLGFITVLRTNDILETEFADHIISDLNELIPIMDKLKRSS